MLGVAGIHIVDAEGRDCVDYLLQIGFRSCRIGCKVAGEVAAEMPHLHPPPGQLACQCADVGLIMLAFHDHGCDLDMRFLADKVFDGIQNRLCTAVASPSIEVSSPLRSML